MFGRFVATAESPLPGTTKHVFIHSLTRLCRNFGYGAMLALALTTTTQASVFNGSCIMEHEEPFTETCFPGLELEAYYQCGGGEQSPGYVYHPDIGLRHFLLWFSTPQGNVYVVDDVIMRTGFGDTCNPDGSVVEE